MRLWKLQPRQMIHRPLTGSALGAPCARALLGAGCSVENGETFRCNSWWMEISDVSCLKNWDWSMKTVDWTNKNKDFTWFNYEKLGLDHQKLRFNHLQGWGPRPDEIAQKFFQAPRLVNVWVDMGGYSEPVFTKKHHWGRPVFEHVGTCFGTCFLTPNHSHPYSTGMFDVKDGSMDLHLPQLATRCLKLRRYPSRRSDVSPLLTIEAWLVHWVVDWWSDWLTCFFRCLKMAKMLHHWSIQPLTMADARRPSAIPEELHVKPMASRKMTWILLGKW